jgi:phosphonate degradation associated HDIG domain protein
MDQITARETAASLIRLFEEHGNEDYIGEDVSQLEHAVQSARLAEEGGYGNDVVIAALLHDIGHLLASKNPEASMGGFGAKAHEKIGADHLRHLGFPEKVAVLVESHVEAKRYLAYRFPEYREALSEASRRTLEYQGGPMNEDEALAFEADPLHELKVQMRKWDEAAKEKGLSMEGWRNYSDRMEKELLMTDL